MDGSWLLAGRNNPDLVLGPDFPSATPSRVPRHVSQWLIKHSIIS